VVAIQDERSQPKVSNVTFILRKIFRQNNVSFNLNFFTKNKAKALQILQARLYDMERNKLHQERSKNRKKQVRNL